MTKFISIVNKVIARCTIILEVLDARFVDETRNIALEEKIKSQGKTLVYTVNKIDLVSTKSYRNKISKLFPRVELSVKQRNGTRKLRDLIKRFSQTHYMNYVGVVGYPNTGKSSVINALCGRTAARVAPQAGHTRGVQLINLSNNIKLLDTPGVMEPVHDTDHILVSGIDFTKVEDPDYYVELIFKKFPGVLQRHYVITSIEDLARKRLFLIKGGEPDIERAARTILMDWQQGRIVV